MFKEVCWHICSRGVVDSGHLDGFLFYCDFMVKISDCPSSRSLILMVGIEVLCNTVTPTPHLSLFRRMVV